MSWLWNWLFVNRKALVLQDVIDQLQAERAELLQRQDDWRATSEAAVKERDAARWEAERAIAGERGQNARTTAELMGRIQQLETQVAEHQQVVQQLERSRLSQNDLIAFRDQQIEEIQLTNSHEINSRDARIQTLEQQVRQLQEQLANANGRIAQESAQSTARINELELQLSASELHSEHRAEQRSALLRNLAEIHRLSSLMTRTELATGGLKLTQPDSTSSEFHERYEVIQKSVPNYSSWNIFGDVESA